jgi:hypothetical protein
MESPAEPVDSIGKSDEKARILDDTSVDVSKGYRLR